MDLSFDIGSLRPVVYNIPEVSTKLNLLDYIGTIKVRWGIGRYDYKVTPGLYKVGNPTSDSDVFVSANYKLSFDTLRKNLVSLNAWILVIDTKGINVWCAAGKGTFGTENLVKSIKDTSLESFVKHRRIIVPQLGATGVAAHKVKQQSGFRVIFGPAMARDIKAFIQANYTATPAMRKMTFPVWDRAKLIPVDFMYRKYHLLIIITAIFFVSGLDSKGFLFEKMLETSLFPLVILVAAYLSGIVVAPLLLPFTPFRAFALKGAIWGLVITLLLNGIFDAPLFDRISTGLMGLSIASFMTMNFTGSTTFTSLSGVKKEMKWAIPIQVAFAFVGLTGFIFSKLII